MGGIDSAPSPINIASRRIARAAAASVRRREDSPGWACTRRDLKLMSWSPLVRTGQTLAGLRESLKGLVRQPGQAARIHNPELSGGAEGHDTARL